jgi:hypothetical protein
MQKGQISFDFLLVAIIFFVLMSVIFGFVNDFEDKNNAIIDNLEMQDTYLKVNDYLMSVKYNKITMFKRLELVSDNCKAESTGTEDEYRLFNTDYPQNSYIISNDERNFELIGCSDLNVYN